jgi:hypothetical protein
MVAPAANPKAARRLTEPFLGWSSELNPLSLLGRRQCDVSQADE